MQLIKRLGGVVRGVTAIALTLLLAALALPAHAQLTGTRNVPGDYATLELAITDLNAVGVGVGGVTINLLAGNPQTAPAGGYVINLAASNATAANPITLRGNANAITASAAHTVGALNDAVFKIIGEDFVTIEGFAMQENAANTVTVAASNTMTEFGVALFYRTATDGAQNATIRGNTVTLNRTYPNTFGVYSNNTHTATAVTTTVNSTGASGANSNLTIRGNTIGNVNLGIVVVGSQAPADHNDALDIGGNATATGNTITNFGTTTAGFSAYANVSGTLYGVLVRNTRSYNVSFNTITSSTGITAGTLRGIYVVTASTAPTGTLTQTINNNAISVRSGVAAGQVQGIQVESGTTTPTSSITINNNTITNSGWTLSATAAFVGIQIAASGATVAPLNTTINGNVFDALTLTTSGSVTLINNSFTRPANAVTTVNNNSTAGNTVKTLAGGTFTCYTSNGSSPNSATETNTGNNFSNIELQGTTATTLLCWQSTDGVSPGTTRKTVSNNTFNNLVNQAPGPVTALSVGFSDNTFAGNDVSGNTVSNIASTSTSSTSTVVGITSSNGNQNFVGNTVHSISAAFTNLVNGISITGGTTQVVARNRVYNLSHSNAGGSVNGVLVSGGTTVNLSNNLIGDLRAPAANGANPVVGMNFTGGTTVVADYNSVFLNATSTGALFGSSAASASAAGTPTLTLRNNNLVNTSTPNGTGVATAYRRSSTTLTSYAATSNNNNFFGPSLFFDGTNNDTTLAAYRARVAPRDTASISELPPWQSTAGTNPNFLNISTTVPTQLESGGVPVAGIATDVAGNPRNATTPDIGAWEFAGILLDLTPPAIGYTPLTNTTLVTNRSISATITDASGVATGANAPRVYFRKGGSGPYVSTACTGSAPGFTCTIDYALIGGVAVGDTINYFVVAQDTVAPTPNVGANPNAGFAATSVNTITTPPTNPNAYLIVPGFPVAVNVGTGETFTSLTNPGGLFEALNAGVLTANVVASITTNLSGETGAVVLNQLLEEGGGAGTYTLTIRPAATVTATVSGSVAGCLVRLNGADRVTIDGSNVAGGTTRDLTFNNTSTAATAAGVCVSSLGLGLGATNNTLRNFNVLGNDATTTLLGVGVGGVAVGTGGPNNNGTRIANLSVRRSIFGIFVSGDSSSLTTGTVIEGNDLTGTGADRVRRVGILVFNDSGTQIVRNRIGGIDSNESADSVGIGVGIQDANNAATVVGGGVINALVAQNEISGVVSQSTTGFSAVGIAVAGGATGTNTIANNTIRGVIGPATSPDFVAGIFVAGATGSTTRVVYNSILLSGDRGTVASQVPSHGTAQVGTTGANLELRNNIVVNTQTSAGGANATSFAFGTGASSFANLSASNNLYFTSGANASGFRSGSLTAAAGGAVINHATLAAWQAASGDTSTLFTDPLYVSATDLNIQPTSPAINAGVSVPGITTDIVGTLRLNPPEIGAFELLEATLSISPISIDFGNVLIGTTTAPQTVTLSNTGNASLTVDPLTAAAAPFARAGGTCSAPPITITAGSSCTLTYTFAPTVTGAASQTFTVTSSGAGSGTIALTGNGIQGNLTITPGSVNFGSVNVGTPSTEQSVTLSNTGTASLDVTALTAAGAPFARTGSGTCSPGLPITITAGSSCTLTYTFTPAAVGPASQNLTVTANAPGSGTIALSGTGVAAEFSVTPNPVAFGNQLVGTTSAPLIATLANTGTGSLSVTGLPDPTAPFARTGGTCAAAPFTLAPSTSCTVIYTFAPAAVGPATGSVAIGSSVGPVALSLTGTGVQGNLVIAPATVPFGNQPIGSTSAPQSVTLSNTGTAALDVTALTTAAAPFARAGGTCAASPPITLTPGGSCTLTYTFAPTVTGPANQVLTVTANAPGSGTITLTGTGTPSADLSIVKSSAVNLIGLGLIQYNLVVANAGPSAVTGAVVADTFPAGLTNVLWSCVGIGGGSCVANGTGNINQLVDLPNGATVVFSITANVPLPLPNAIVNTATVTAPSGTTDPVATNNTSTVNDVILIFADGFESAALAVTLPETASGEVRVATVPAEAINVAASGVGPRDAIRYQVAGASVIVQARRIGDSVQVRSLAVDAAGEWTVGVWVATSGAPVLLEWSTGAAVGGRTPVSARLRFGN